MAGFNGLWCLFVCVVCFWKTVSSIDFFMDRQSDCDGRERVVGNEIIRISGRSAGANMGEGVLSCTINLKTENLREPMIWKINFQTVNIINPHVQFYVYDGTLDGEQMWGFSKYSPKPSNMVFDFTHGPLVTFRLTRGPKDADYEIRLVLEPTRKDVSRCNEDIDAYGCDEYGYTYRILGTKEIIGIVGGVFALIVVVIIVIVVCCYRRQRGITHRWKQDKLGNVNTAASIHSLNGRVNTNKNNSNRAVWASEGSKIASIRRSPNLPRAKVMRNMQSDDSMFDSQETLEKKRPLPSTNRYDGRRGDRDRRRDYRDRDSDKYSDTSYSTHDRDSGYKPPTYREAMRRDSDSDLSDDRRRKPQIEREIVLQGKPRSIATETKKQPPPPEEDTTYDSIEPKVVSKALGTDDEVIDESDTSEDGGSTDSEPETKKKPLASDTESDDDNRVDQPDTGPLYSKPNKAKTKGKQQPQAQVPPQIPPQYNGSGQPYPAQFQQMPYPGYLPPGVQQPQPRYGYPMMQPMPQQQPGTMPANPYLQAQFTVPIQPQGAPVPPVQNSAVPRGPPQNAAPAREHHPSNRREKKPTNTLPGNQPPVYSYLVNRGYKPVDGRYSPVSTSTAASSLSADNNLGPTDDSDFSPNLGSGVDLMKRQTAI